MNYLLFVKSTESLSHPTLFERNSAHYNLISHTCFSFSVSNFVFSDNGRRVIIVLNCSSLTFHKCSAPPPPEAVFFSEKKGAKKRLSGPKINEFRPWISQSSRFVEGMWLITYLECTVSKFVETQYVILCVNSFSGTENKGIFPTWTSFFTWIIAQAGNIWESSYF